MKRVFMLLFGLAFLAHPALSESGHDEKEHSHQEGETQADEHEEEGSVSNVGPDKGVLEASKAKGFKLTKEAVAHLGIKAVAPKKEGDYFLLPKSALVSVMRERFIYTLNDGFYKPVEIIVVRSSGSQILVKPEHGEITGQVATEGVHFLRNIEVDVFSGDEGGHHH